MRILVTGGTGFIGSALCSRLSQEGEHQIAVFHRPTSYSGGLKQLPLTRFSGDISDENAIGQAIAQFRPQVIYHLAAQMSTAPTVQRIMQMNALGTRHVLQAALKNRTDRVVLMSTACTLGLPEVHRSDKTPPPLLNETQVKPLEPLWAFAQSKHAAEFEAQTAALDGLDTVIVNPFWVIGPGDWYRRRSSFLLSLKKKAPVIMSRGGINVISVDDAVTGLINACQYGQRGERYLLCGQNLPLFDFCTLCAQSGNFEPPRLLLEDENAAKILMKSRSYRGIQLECLENNLFYYINRFFYYDSARSRIALHLPPQQELSTVLQKTYQWFEENV